MAATCIALLACSGAAQIVAVDPSPVRREYATKLGASMVLDPKAVDPVEAIREQTEGRVNGFVSAVGTGGTLAGVGMALQPKGVKIALALSLALNLLVLGLVGGALLSFGLPGDRDDPRLRTLGLGPFALALEREDRDEAVFRDMAWPPPIGLPTRCRPASRTHRSGQSCICEGAL